MLITRWLQSLCRPSRRSRIRKQRKRDALTTSQDVTQIQRLEDRTLLTVLLFEDFEDAAVTYTNVA